MRKHITQLGKFVKPDRKEGQSFKEWEKELIHRIAAKREMWRWWRRTKCLNQVGQKKRKQNQSKI